MSRMIDLKEVEGALRRAAKSGIGGTRAERSGRFILDEPVNAPTTTAPDDILYQRDFHAWCVQQAAALRARILPGANDGLDYDNLAEEIDCLGRSDRRSIKSHMRILLAHLLKWRHQPARRGDSWDDSIFNARSSIADLLRESPSLVKYSREVIGEAYPLAVRDAASETKMPRRDFATTCPFTDTQVFDPDFLPTDLDTPASD